MSAVGGQHTCRELFGYNQERRVWRPPTTITKHQPLSEEHRATLRRERGVVLRRRSTDKPERFVPKIHVTGYIDSLELMGRRDDEEDTDRRHDVEPDR